MIDGKCRLKRVVRLTTGRKNTKPVSVTGRKEGLFLVTGPSPRQVRYFRRVSPGRPGDEMVNYISRTNVM